MIGALKHNIIMCDIVPHISYRMDTPRLLDSTWNMALLVVVVLAIAIVITAVFVHFSDADDKIYKEDTKQEGTKTPENNNE